MADCDAALVSAGPASAASRDSGPGQGTRPRDLTPPSAAAGHQGHGAAARVELCPTLSRVDRMTVDGDRDGCAIRCINRCPAVWPTS
jgi:hypothetical protein